MHATYPSTQLAGTIKTSGLFQQCTPTATQNATWCEFSCQCPALQRCEELHLFMVDVYSKTIIPEICEISFTQDKTQ